MVAFLFASKVFDASQIMGAFRPFLLFAAMRYGCSYMTTPLFLLNFKVFPSALKSDFTCINNGLRRIFTVWWEHGGNTFLFIYQYIRYIVPTFPLKTRFLARIGGK